VLIRAVIGTEKKQRSALERRMTMTTTATTTGKNSMGGARAPLLARWTGRRGQYDKNVCTVHMGRRGSVTRVINHHKMVILRVTNDCHEVKQKEHPFSSILEIAREHHRL
jgi:hypothetical protein